MSGRAYYNENDPYAAQWLRNLIAAGHIAPGDVDERSILDVRPDDLARCGQCHFFAGIGGWSYALRLAGWPDDRPVWTGSCPCQPFSAAGKQKGFADDRHLWPEFRRLIAERRPATIFGEQVASATAWLGLVRGDLEALDYAVGAMPVEAASAGADHLRDRYWFVADANEQGPQGRTVHAERADQRAVGPDGVAHADQPCESEGREQRGGEQRGAGGDPQARDGGDDLWQCRECGRIYSVEEENAIDGQCPFCGERSRPVGNDQGERRREGRPKYEVRSGRDSAPCDGGSILNWVIGADGKARRVKSGIRLLVDGVPNRVAKLRALGNAIDPRPAAEFIRASSEALT